MTNITTEQSANVMMLLKFRLGITTDKRDTYMQAIINSVIQELERHQGLTIDLSQMDMMLFIVDYAEYRYNHREEPTMPRHLTFRLHNFIIKSHKGGELNA